MHALADKFDCDPLKDLAWKYIQQSQPQYAVAPDKVFGAMAVKDNNRLQGQPSAPFPPPEAFMGSAPEVVGATTISSSQKSKPPKASDVVSEWKRRLQGSWTNCQTEFQNAGPPRPRPLPPRPPPRPLPPSGPVMGMGAGVAQGVPTPGLQSRAPPRPRGTPSPPPRPPPRPLPPPGPVMGMGAGVAQGVPSVQPLVTTPTMPL